MAASVRLRPECPAAPACASTRMGTRSAAWSGTYTKPLLSYHTVPRWLKVSSGVKLPALMHVRCASAISSKVGASSGLNMYTVLVDTVTLTGVVVVAVAGAVGAAAVVTGAAGGVVVVLTGAAGGAVVVLTGAAGAVVAGGNKAGTKSVPNRCQSVEESNA